jgi:hypothetical protein
VQHVLRAVAVSGPEPRTLDLGLGVLAALLAVDNTRAQFHAQDGAATVLAAAKPFQGGDPHS